MPGHIVRAPVSGRVIALSEVPDPVFAQELLGPGVALDPPRSGPGAAVAPFAGRVQKAHPHAVVLAAPSGLAVLIHLGIDTVQLRGVGFDLHISDGDEVASGAPLVTWNPQEIAAGGRSPLCVVVALEGKRIDLCAPLENVVAAGDPLFSC